MKRIVIGCDHAGLNLKNAVAAHLSHFSNLKVTDVGTYTPDSCHYPLMAEQVCNCINEGDADLGILICGTGIGMSIAANKHKGIRAACCSDTYSAKMTRLHNDANVLCFGERVVGSGLAFDLVDAFIFSEFEGGKHSVRVDIIKSFED